MDFDSLDTTQTIKTKNMNIDEKELKQYIKDNSTAQDEILNELERVTNLSVVQPRMLSGQIQGKILEMLTLMLRPKNVLEIGTFTGYSAICMAKGLPEGAVIDSCDVNDEISYIAEKFVAKHNLCDKINLHIGSAIDIAPKLGKVFDLVFIDGDKREYPEYYNMLFDNGLVKSGSFMFADNVLWDGKVVDKSEKNLKDKYTQGVLKFNKMVIDDKRVEVVILPIRDGISIIRVL